MSDDERAAALNRLTDTLLAQLEPPHGIDVASVVYRLNQVSRQVNEILGDVVEHGIAIGGRALGVEYVMAWAQLVTAIRKAAEQDGCIDPHQLLDVMQELHVEHKLTTRAPKDETETTS